MTDRKFMMQDDEYLTSPTNETEMDDIVHYPFADVDLRLGRWDTKRAYKIYDHVVHGEKFIQLSENSLVCLATQSSIDRMHSIVEVIQLRKNKLRKI